MRRWNLLPIVLLGAAACGGDEPAADDQVPVEQPAPVPPDTGAMTAAPDTGATTTTAQAAPVTQQTTPAPARVAPVRRPESGGMAAADEPWTPAHTGTVNPGMTREEVVGVWGPPVTERTLGAWTYLYFRNGCEVSCGTFDVVFLENGSVVNAIVRGAGHTYGGTSTSPPGQEPHATPPGRTEG
jgi:hypothetical protein